MRFFSFSLWPALAGCLFAGCATGTKTDWNARVGNYTYGQAVQELGVPNKSAKAGGGDKVAEWLVSSYSPPTIESGGDAYVGQPGWVAPELVAAYPKGPDSGRWLRLVFTPDGTLLSWKSYGR